MTTRTKLASKPPRPHGTVRRVQIEMQQNQAQLLDAMTAEMDMSQSGVIRMSLRLLQMVVERTRNNEKLAFVDSNGTFNTVELLQIAAAGPAHTTHEKSGVSQKKRTM